MNGWKVQHLTQKQKIIKRKNNKELPVLITTLLNGIKFRLNTEVINTAFEKPYAANIIIKK